MTQTRGGKKKKHWATNILKQPLLPQHCCYPAQLLLMKTCSRQNLTMKCKAFISCHGTAPLPPPPLQCPSTGNHFHSFSHSPLCEPWFLTPPERLQKPVGLCVWKDRIIASLRLEKTSTSVENHNLGGNKMTLEEFKRQFQVNPIILPRDITGMSSKDTQKTNSLTFFGTASISFF